MGGFAFMAFRRDCETFDADQVSVSFLATIADVHAVFLDRRYLPVRVRSLIDFLQAAFTHPNG